MENIIQEINIFFQKTFMIIILSIIGVTSRILIKSKDKKLTKLEIFTSYFIGTSFAVIFGLLLHQNYSETPYIGYAWAYVIGKVGEDISTYLIKQFSQENIKETLKSILKLFKK